MPQEEAVFSEESYKIIGAAFSVFNYLGWGLPEKDYQKALVEEFFALGLSAKKEVYIPLQYKTANIGRYFADFVINDRILVEIKVVPKLSYDHAKQVLTYLRIAKLKLGILVYFTKEGIKYRRILNSQVDY
ncbi:hypothetical protein A2524_03925 [Candidatus Wolfebacteria bacterium RIFOXYD12_FULL_48_21]|uniref:GxxExxY protein n=1 Tax=Candidatus Wolfebacteria bacterium RIFOXYD1_FULL_48_65 TaxID=1802561 RepID=A0A1F8E583_9BACT|nr:MAG: hypothetical protein A2524_03925 [Candidatus Wolfebacteria bacterium RIFOXYD12_FULL_48_21]OGM95338.1 MAG: hypothetical protein A2610_02515 [Candidatus Wolfebacteria bacterium RIFOXYD1_FULL_48_65]OGM95918.1 MAG: hypothetical protein A2532_02550 [Candidatus Wolfebacteria bacterium RIFOXYD2_FULL_48_11]